MMMTAITAAYAGGKGAAPPVAEGNVVANPSFEDGSKGWNVWGGAVAAVARSGKAGLAIRNAEVKWSGADQVIVLPEGAANIAVSGWIKTDSVAQGNESWETARISVEFRDGLGGLVGGYPPVTGQAVGTTGWTHYSRTYRVSTAARTVILQCALGNALGAAYFDDVSLIITNRKGDILKPGRLSGVMDEGEWYVLKAKPNATGSHYVDWSGLLDAPAGKHGFLTVNKDGNLLFEDGTAAKFWGTNLVAKDVFAPDAQIDSAVSRLAKMGANILRLHHIDAPWTSPNIFGNAKGTRKLSEKSLRQLDYLIYRCKEKGIYIFLDLLVHRNFMKEDGVDNPPPDLGGKQVGFFSKKLIELQKEYGASLLNHTNQFTGVAYKDEPAIAAILLINESTIFSAFSGDILTPPYREELEELWNEWLARAGSCRQAVDSADTGINPNTDINTDNNINPDTDIHTDTGANINPGQDPAASPLSKKLAVFGLDWKDDRPRLKVRSDDGDARETIRFLSALETSYFTDMREHFSSLGAKQLFVGSNMPLPLLAMLRDNAALDIISTNEYWDHPQVWKIGDDWDRILEAPFHNRSQFLNPRASGIQNRSYYRVERKPFIMTEWNHCYPNEYVLEGVPLIAAYGALQGWDGILQFDFNLDRYGVDRILNYKLSVQPEHVAQWVTAAPMFLRGDVKAAPGLIVEGISGDQYEDVPNYSETLWNNYHLPYITKVAKGFDRPSDGDIEKYAKYYDRDSGVIRSETGELALNGKIGYMAVNAPRVQGAAGFVGGRKFDFSTFSYEISNKHASIFIVSADGNDLAASKRFYIIATGPAKMDGQVYDPARNQLENAGDGNVLVQVINGKITFNKIGGKKLQVFPLDTDGKRGKAMKIKKSKGTAGVMELGKGRTLVYEAVVK
jgi:hypothetical protein